MWIYSFKKECKETETHREEQTEGIVATDLVVGLLDVVLQACILTSQSGYRALL